MKYRQLLAASSTILFMMFTASAAENNGATNLQVLPADIPRTRLNQIMLENLTGLGLTRREGEGCLFCHEGSMDIPRTQWDFASDAKATKATARVMMQMVQEINEHLANLEERVAPGLRVSCDTCHAGRTDPRPLPELLIDVYNTEGIASLLANYQNLRQRYFGSDAYDFQEQSLTTVATNLALQGNFDDAITVAQLNESMNPSLSSTGFTLTVQTLQQVLNSGSDQGINYFERKWRELGSPAEGFVVLDNVGWQLFRSGQPSLALRIFEHNLSLFAANYVTHESLADALWNTNDPDNRQRALQIFTSWLAENPDHATANRRLQQLQSTVN